MIDYIMSFIELTLYTAVILAWTIAIYKMIRDMFIIKMTILGIVLSSTSLVIVFIIIIKFIKASQILINLIYS